MADIMAFALLQGMPCWCMYHCMAMAAHGHTAIICIGRNSLARPAMAHGHGPWPMFTAANA
eukprot:5903163-Pleurochrysis_carterae.AAC.3